MRLLSVKQTGSLSTSKDEVVLDFDARWCGDPTIVLNVAIMGLTLRVRLQELQVLGPLRVCLANFDDRLPCFHVLKVAFVSQPEVQFSLSLIGGDIDMLPGVKETVTEIVGKSLARALVWPKYVKVPIAPGKEGRGGGDFRAGSSSPTRRRSGAQARARAEAQEHRLVRRLRPIRHDARHEQLEAGGQVERDHRRSEPAVERDV